MKRQLILEWIEKAVALPLEGKISIPAETRQETKELVKMFKKELKILAEIDPLKASKIFVSLKAAEGIWWLTLTRVAPTSLIGFVTVEGKTERIELEDPDRKRRIMLMKEDGYSLEEVVELEGELTEDERRMLG